jgi:methyl-accepting chemotaxis protein
MAGTWPGMSLTIRAKLILTSATLIVLLGGSLWFVRGSLGRGADAVAAQRTVLAELETANAAGKSFGELRYWLTDLAVSQLNEAEQFANKAGEALEGHLRTLEARHSKRVATVRQHVAEIRKDMLEAAKAYLDDNRVLGNSLVSQSRQRADTVSGLIQEIVADRQVQATQAGDLVVTMGERSKWLSLVLLLASIAVGTTLTFVTVRSVTRPIGKVMAAVQTLADGDLTAHVDVTGRDEMAVMGQALNGAIRQMAATVHRVSTTVSHVSSASQHLSGAAGELSAGAQAQASSLEETAAALEQMTATVKQSADSAREASTVATGSRDAAEKGGHVVAQAVAAMSEINQASRRIADIITVIDEIAFQTNLLALNAAVEAARAGEQGRGFAVVAAEVRNLAQRSAGAAKEIKGLIQDSLGKVDRGAEMVNRSGVVLQEIVESVKRMAGINGEISRASTEQSQGIDQVNRAVSQMDRVVQQGAAQTEELSGTAQSLAAQAQELQALIGQFRLDERGPGAPAAALAGHVVAAPTPSAGSLARTPRPASRPAPAAVSHGAAGTRDTDDVEEL